MRFGKKGKLAPRFIGPYKIIERVGRQAYKLELPPELSGVHNVFHVSYLRKCLTNAEEILPTPDVTIDPKLQYIEEPEAIVDQKVRKLRNKKIETVLVRWKHSRGPHLTWELKSEMEERYPDLFRT